MARNATYYDGDLRSDLINAALRRIEADGPASISIRSLAKELGVSHAAPANHFKDKRSLFTAIAADGFDRLGAAFIDALATVAENAGALAALEAGGRAYIDFGLAHRAHFEVMWRNELLDQHDSTLNEAAEATFSFLRDIVIAAQTDGWSPHQDPDALAVYAWSVVHGFVALWLQGPLPSMTEAPTDDLIDGVVAAVVTRA